jgi:site-specific recombinase XerD
VSFSFGQNKPKKGMTPMIVHLDPKPVELSCLHVGPLGPHIESFATLLAQQGYSRNKGWQKMRLVADLSRWLQHKRASLKELSEDQTDRYLRVRWRRVSRRVGDQITMSQLLQHLRQTRAIPNATPALRSEIDLLERDYRSFLLQERGLTATSVQQYVTVARRFLCHRFSTGKVRLKNLCAQDVTDFVLQDTSRRGRRSAQLMATVLRSFLRFLLQRGRIATNLAAAVPTVAGWRLSELPRYLEVEQVEKVLRSCDRRQKVGKRDYAILLLLARLGLRAGEVANLALEDIDWRTGVLLVHGKGARLDKLPLPHDVGQALVDYLRKGRPDCSCRRVFIQSKAPYVGFANPPNTVCGIVRRALARAHIDSRHQGAHVLRHSLATRMLGNGASLAQIGQVLRHQQVQTTEIYAKVDLTSLSRLALPWPGGVR